MPGYIFIVSNVQIDNVGLTILYNDENFLIQNVCNRVENSNIVAKYQLPVWKVSVNHPLVQLILTDL